MTAGSIVFILCAITALTCCVLLARAYRATRVRLLLWASVCFAGLFLNNFLLVVDTSIIPELDLLVLRQAPALVGIALLLYGLVWEGRGR